VLLPYFSDVSPAAYCFGRVFAAVAISGVSPAAYCFLRVLLGSHRSLRGRGLIANSRTPPVLGTVNPNAHVIHPFPSPFSSILIIVNFF
jgi:hypothetical protein